MGSSKHKLGEFIYKIERRNTDLQFGIDFVRGISNTKEIMQTKADVDEKVLHKFLIVMPNEFVYNPRTTRMGDKVGMGYNQTGKPFLSTFNNIVFGLREEAKTALLSDYLYIYFRRPEFDRYAIIHSWGSATELFSFEEMCDIEIDLPTIDVQKRYVAIYNELRSNQQSYERGLEDLRLTCDALIENFKHSAPRTLLREIVQEVDLRNRDGTITSVDGVNKEKRFMPTVASGEDISKYKVVGKNCFACNLMHVGRDAAVPIALNTEDQPIIVSPAYLVFAISDSKVLPKYALIWLSRSETDRYAWFMCDASVRSGMEKTRFYDIDIPIPSIEEQKALVEVFEVLSLRREINERLKAQIRDICPILIKGSLEEGEK